MEISKDEERQVANISSNQILQLIIQFFALELIFPLCVIFRLWDKVEALQREPVPGRSHFIERMRAMVSFLFLEKFIKFFHVM